MYENRMHIHVGKKSTFELCKIWLEPTVEIAKVGELTPMQINEVLNITKKYQKELVEQWNNFVQGKAIQIIKIK